MSHKNIETIELITDILRSLTDKPPKVIVSIVKLIKSDRRKSCKNKILMMLIIIWIIVSLLLTKSFSSVLLNTYFNPNTHLAVNSMQQIIESPDLSVAGIGSLNYLNASKPEEYLKLKPRVKEYEKQLIRALHKKKFDPHWVSQSEKALDLILSGRTVFLFQSHDSTVIKRMNPWLSLETAPDKYSPNYITIFVSKKHFCYKKIVLM